MHYFTASEIIKCTRFYRDYVRWVRNEGQESMREVEQRKERFLFLIIHLLNAGGIKLVNDGAAAAYQLLSAVEHSN